MKIPQLLRLPACLGLIQIASVGLLQNVQAGSGTWLATPEDNNWNNPANWSSGMVPSSFDTATLAASAITSLSIHDFSTVDEMYFPAGASAYTFVLHLPMYFSFYLTGIVNVSGVTQNFLLTARSGSTMDQGVIIFDYGTTAGANTAFTCEAAATNDGAQGSIQFEQSSAGSGTYHNLGATVPGGVGGRTDFYFTDCTAADSTITNDGATISGATGGATAFSQSKPSAGNATLIANGGSNGGGGGFFAFNDGSLGGTARLEVFGNGYMDMSSHSGSSFSIGSIEGDGQIYLGKTTFLVGSNNLSTTFSGMLHPGSPSGGSGTGALTKIGIGTLTLSGANLYTAGTTVSVGTLVVNNVAGSATGTGAVTVDAGTLGGKGIISGALIVGASGFLAPAHGTKTPATLTIQSSLTLNSSSIYTSIFKAKGNKARTDKVIANGVTINNGANFDFSGTAQGTLTQGLVLTAISNTAATPIAGTFSNLPDGAIVTVGANHFQASYTGGDGNDLTLIVVP